MLNLEGLTVPPEDIDPFPAFLPRGFHTSMTWYSSTRPHLYLGKPEDAIRPTAAAFWMRYYLGKEDASSLNSILFCDKACLNVQLQSPHFYCKEAFDHLCQADHLCQGHVSYKIENIQCNIMVLSIPICQEERDITGSLMI